MRKINLLAATACLALAAAPVLAETVAITHARLLTSAPAGEIAQGTIVIRDGKIAAVGAKVEIPKDARIIDGQGSVVSPGLFATASMIGAVEVNAVGSDLSVSNPAIGPAFDLQYGLDPASTLIPVARLGGLTSAVVLPETANGYEGDEDLTAGGGKEPPHAGGIFAGQGVVIHLDGQPDIVTKAGVGMVTSFGRSGARLSGGARGGEFSALQATLADVRDYMKNRAAYETAGYRELGLSKADLDALVPMVQGRTPVIAVVHRASDIRAVLKWAKTEKLKLILEGAEEGWMVASEIAQAGVPVVISPTADRPETFEALASTLENASRLNAAGVLVALEGPEGNSHRAKETRYGAGNAVAHGMPYGAALAAITINPARIFGVADRTGSLEVGKDADLVIWSGDPLEPLSQAKAVFIRGVSQPMTSRQTELRDRYKDLSRPLPHGYSH